MSAITPATMFMISAGISTAGTLMQLSAQRAASAEMRRRYEQEAKIAEFEGLQAELQRRLPHLVVCGLGYNASTIEPLVEWQLIAEPLDVPFKTHP